MSQAPSVPKVDDYQSALDLLYGRINYERTASTAYNQQNFRLDRMRRMLEWLGNPHLQYPIIHIAGTKGKGTTATLIYDALRANGMRAGLYTSPHLVQLEERFQFDGHQCSPLALVALTQAVLEAVGKVESAGLGCPTFFEMTTAMGFLYFAQCKADCVVLEVGLGGRLDSTNVCNPVLCIITSISLDHQAQLGDTLAAIAAEKAGIIKPGIPVIATAREPEACQVIEEVANAKGASLQMIQRDFEVDWRCLDKECFVSQSQSAQAVAEIAFCSSSTSVDSLWSPSRWLTRMMGRHQADNMAGAVAALQLLSDSMGWKLNYEVSRAALAESHPQARLQVIERDPVRIIDTAHNPVSIQAGLRALADHFGDVYRIVVFACSRDKDFRTMLQQILPCCNRLICTAFLKNPRAVDPYRLASIATEIVGSATFSSIDGTKEHAPSIDVLDCPVSAWQHATRLCPRDGQVVAMGSFFLAAELMDTPPT